MYENDNTISLWDQGDCKEIVLKDCRSGQIHRFSLRNSFIIGRNKDMCDLVISEDDRYISGRHVRFMKDNQRIYVEDMGSKNGTFVNGLRIAQKTRVSFGDRIRLGHSEYVLQV